MTTARSDSAVREALLSLDELPTSTGVAVELLNLTKDQEGNADHISSLVELDPVISARLLRLVNSPFAGAPRRIASVRRAVAFLGVQTVSRIALGFKLAARRREEPNVAYDLRCFWSESIVRGVSARAMVTRSKDFAPDEAFTCGLLCRLGRLGLASLFPKESRAANDARRQSSGVALLDAERTIFATDHDALCADMFASWHMPSIFCTAVRIQGDPAVHAEAVGTRAHKFACVLYLADLVARRACHAGADDTLLAEIQGACERCGIEPSVDQELLEKIASESRALSCVLSLESREVPSDEEIYALAAQRRGWDATSSPSGTGPHEAQRNREALRAVVVEGDRAALNQMGGQLMEAGYEVLKTATARGAMSALLSEGAPIVLIGERISDMSALELCRLIRRHPAIPFAYLLVFVAADAGAAAIIETYNAGADAVAVTPRTAEELIARLSAARRIAHLRQALDARSRDVHRYNAEMEIANAKLGEANEDLSRMATTDEMTGLVNRREALHLLSQCWAASVRHDMPLSIIAVDIDRFKACNDTHGHAVGDAVLKEVAKAMRQTVRQEETVCRIGGEEFLILCPQSEKSATFQCAERVRAAVENQTVAHDGHQLNVTISLGVAERTPDIESPDQLLRAADSALYAAKHAGRNTVRTAGATLPRGPRHDEIPPAPSANDNQPPDPANPSCRVLVVDSDRSAQSLCQSVLRRAGFQVELASDGATAVTLAERTSPDVILVAAETEAAPGLRCTAAIKANSLTQHIPLIQTSSRAAADHVATESLGDADEHLAKPINPTELVVRVSSMARLGRETQRNNEWRGEQSRALGLLQDFSRKIAAAESLDGVLEQTVQVAATLVCTQSAAVLLPDADGRVLSVAKSLGFDPDGTETIRVPVGEGVCGRVFVDRECVAAETMAGETQTNPSDPDARLLAARPWACLALCVPQQSVGVITVAGRRRDLPFSPLELDFLDLVCNVAATAVHERLTLRARDDARHSIVVALAKLAEHRDQVTGRHLDRVTRYCGVLADQLRRESPYAERISDRFIDDLQRAAPLHDIGKVAIPDRILLNPAKLTPEETELMRTHTIVGAQTIRSVVERVPGVSFLSMAEDIAYAHHEWFDGTGYPRGLCGEAIPLPARITAVADVYDAITTKRPYKEVMSHKVAVDIIVKSSGKQFDPQVVEAFLARESEFRHLAAELADPSGGSAPANTFAPAEPVMPAESVPIA